METLLTRLVLGGLLIVAAACDLRTMRIPNALSLAIIAVFIGTVAMGAVRPIAPHLLSFAIAAILGVLLFGFGIWGGGDTKLFAACALLMTPGDLGRFLFMTSLAGGVVALAIVLYRRWTHLEVSPRTSMPYGLALAAGGLDWCLLS